MTPTTATPEPARTPYRHAVRVYWEDTDAGGVVFYANYLKYFERARTEWLRELGFSQQQLRNAEGVMFVVTDTAVRYLRAARLDDLLDITVDPQRSGGASLRIAQQAWRGEELLAEGDIRIGCVRRGDTSMQPCRTPAALRDRMQ
jgi:acyl-CoA thioester hydrolase